MQIDVKGLGKRYNKQWVFRHLDYQFNYNASYAITGPNGSGKSTLLQILSGFFPPSEGTISYQRKDAETIKEEAFYNHFDIVTPYLELIEEFTLQEFIEFHFKFKKVKVGLSLDEVVYRMYLDQDRNKLIKNFSSGMKQRLKLGIAFFSQSPICFLDEPTSNLDEKGVSWYIENVKAAINDKLVIISSNQVHEYDFCDHVLNIPDFQQTK